jgi:hypothetical protein
MRAHQGRWRPSQPLHAVWITVLCALLSSIQRALNRKSTLGPGLRCLGKIGIHQLPGHEKQTYHACVASSAVGVATDVCSLYEEVEYCAECMCALEARKQYRQTSTSWQATKSRLTLHAVAPMQVASPEMLAYCSRKRESCVRARHEQHA